jgi:hypothetical protein
MNTCKAIDLNNSAVASLQQGRHQEAVALLKTAIADLKDHCAVVHKQGPCSADDNDHSSSMKVEQEQDKPAILSVPLWTEESFEQKHDKNLIFVYAQAIVLAQGEHRREMVIAVVLYNIALANHAWAIESDTSSLLAVALKFYSMSVAIIQGQNGDDANASSYWLLLALNNNMAQIYLSRACSEKLRGCLGNIQALLSADRVGQIIDSDDYAFFLTNSMLQLSVVAAPAA